MLNHSSAFVISIQLLYIVLAFVLQFAAGISLLNERGQLDCDTLDNRGDVVQRLYGSGLCDLKPD